MPLYSYCCPECGTREEYFRTVAARHSSIKCACGAGMRKEFSLPHLDILEPYFDEGLGCDIYSASHRRRVMRQLDVIEAGDRVGGAINFDRRAPEHVGKLPMKGREPAQVIRRDQPVGVVDSMGELIEGKLFSELEVS